MTVGRAIVLNPRQLKRFVTDHEIEWRMADREWQERDFIELVTKRHGYELRPAGGHGSWDQRPQRHPRLELQDGVRMHPLGLVGDCPPTRRVERNRSPRRWYRGESSS